MFFALASYSRKIQTLGGFSVAYLLQLNARHLKSERSVQDRPMRKNAIVSLIRELHAHTILCMQMTYLDMRICAKISRNARTKSCDRNLLLIRTVKTRLILDKIFILTNLRLNFTRTAVVTWILSTRRL